MTVLALQVAAGADDGDYGDTGGGQYLIAQSVHAVGNTLALGGAESVNARFTGVSGLNGATINSAVYSVHGFLDGIGSPLTKIRAEDAAAPAAIPHEDSDEWESRTLTTAGVDWDDALVDDAWNDSPSIVSVIDEIKSLDPSVIQIFHLDDGSAVNEGHAYDEYESDSALAPKLTIDYTAAGSEGTAAQTLPSLTQSAAGAVAIAATCAQTLPALSQASAASVPSNGTAAQTLPSLTQAATGAISVAGQASQTLPAIVQAAAGKAIVGGDGASLLPSIGQSGIAKVLITGTGSQTLPGVRQAAVGGGPLVRVCLRISDQARYSLAIADGARYRVAVSDQARNAVALTDAARYALQTTDSARYDLATSDETC